jgi:hypothetical protein
MNQPIVDKNIIVSNTTVTEDIICNICHSQGDDMIKLSCSHDYCYNCIKSYFIYSSMSINKRYYSKKLQCPYCRTDVNFLPLLNNDIPLQFIHVEYKKKSKSDNNKCSFIKNSIQCKYKIKYNGYCGYHKKNDYI